VGYLNVAGQSLNSVSTKILTHKLEILQFNFITVSVHTSLDNSS
jgi:hypothetical protein